VLPGASSKPSGALENGDLYALDRKPEPILEAGCWAHSRRKVFELADVETAAIKQARGDKPKPVYPLASTPSGASPKTSASTKTSSMS
jgi:hypothetical protein